MSSIAFVSVDEYLRTDYKPAREYRDGVLSQKSMPTKLHAQIQLRLQLLLIEQGLEALAEVTVRLGPTKFLVPDVIAHPIIESPYPIEPVLLCIEILSPGDRPSAAFAKCEEYQAWGVPFCWVVDPQKQEAWEYHRDSSVHSCAPTGTLHAGDVQIALTELFR